jgi:hypothetical protein
MTPEQIAVLADHMRSLGVNEHIVKWVEHPGAVSLLLSRQPYRNEWDTIVCQECLEHYQSTHRPDCPVRLAEIAISIDPEQFFQRERDIAYHEALLEKNRREPDEDEDEDEASEDAIDWQD